MKPVLFVGPTLHGVSVALMSEFDMRAPARCGDIVKAVKGGADRIGLVDGFFGDCRSVWHKEILFGLSQGAGILGAASMGALRAAECDYFGMVGVGEIYEEFKDGRRTSDSDVAVLHGPQEMAFVPLTVALVDAEATIQSLKNASAITVQEAATLHDAAGDLGFRKRTWDALCAAAGFTDSQTTRIKVALGDHFVSRKKIDALALIDFMANSANNEKEACNKLVPARTVYLDSLLDSSAD